MLFAGMAATGEGLMNSALSPGVEAGIELGLAAGFTASAIYGIVTTAECREMGDLQNAYDPNDLKSEPKTETRRQPGAREAD